MAGLDDAIAGAVAFIRTSVLVDTVRVSAPASTEPVFNPETGNMEYPVGETLYEGDGAVLPASADPASAVATGDLPWVNETRSAYKLLTPLDAPIVPRGALVKVTTVHNPANTGLLGRSWLASDPGRAGTVEAVRITFLDQVQGEQAGSTP